MKIKLTICCIVALLVVAGAWQYTVPLVRYSTPASGSNIVLVDNNTGSNGSTHAAYTVTLTTAAGAGDCAVIIANDYNALPAAPTDSASDTFTNRASLAGTHGDGYIDLWTGAISSGVSSVTMNSAASGYSIGNVRVYSGTACATDVLDASAFGSSSNTMTTHSVSGATTYDLAVSAWVDATSATNTISSLLDNWVSPATLGNSSFGQTFFTANVLNGYASNFTANLIPSTAGHNYDSAVFIFKSSTSASTPSGISPLGYLNFNTGSPSGTALTTALLNQSSHGSLPGFWTTNTGNFNGFTLSSSAAASALHSTLVNGVEYATNDSTLGLSYDMTTNPTNYVDYTLPVAAPTLYVLTEFTTPTDVTSQQDWVAIASGGDHAMLDLNQSTGHAGIECQSTTTDFSFSFTAHTLYYALLEYNAGGTHSLTLYNSSGTSLGSVSCAATGSNNATNVDDGQSHASPATAGSLYIAHQWISTSAITP